MLITQKSQDHFKLVVLTLTLLTTNGSVPKLRLTKLPLQFSSYSSVEIIIINPYNPKCKAVFCDAAIHSQGP